MSVLCPEKAQLHSKSPWDGQMPHPHGLTWGAGRRGLWAGVLVGDALQGRERHVQATVGAGPEGAEAVAVEICVTLRGEGTLVRALPCPSPPTASLVPS